MRKKDALDICLRNILSYTDRNNPEKRNNKVKRLVIQGEMGSVTLHLGSTAQVEVVSSSRWEGGDPGRVTDAVDE